MLKRFLLAFIAFIGLIVPGAFTQALLAAPPASPAPLQLPGCDRNLADANTPAAQQVFGNEKAVKFNILPSGTTLGAGFATASNDPVTHNAFSADQKLYDALHVTTAVTDVGQTTSNKSVQPASN